ncbi:glycosyltransferase [Limosilactobacillus reuteri]|uniref:glycosyltransferase n=1 Tax=Limosilactobacillus reuteri TaxID=1598 RepID=UPI001E320882|nr:glycosyltransferase [Limosilactobacillus reuteri]MCC4410167.1 glycosyltransferase [Limosilactobacillus reuteri]
MKEKINNKFPDFSVLMSVYKNEKPNYLDKALNSIENQTIIPKEIVVVQDGPITDALNQVLKKHSENFVNTFKIIKSKKNQGLGAALCLGTSAIDTNWIARMDSDDISVPERFEKQLIAILNDVDLALVGGQVSEFATNINNLVGSRSVPTSEKEIQKFVKWRSPFNHPTIMIRKDVLENVGGYIPYGNLEDYYLWSRIISQNYRVKNLSDTLVYMRVDEGMYSRRGKVSNIQYFYKLRKFLRKQKMISFPEQIMGNAVMTVNIIIPSFLRKLLYQKILHR